MVLYDSRSISQVEWWMPPSTYNVHGCTCTWLYNVHDMYIVRWVRLTVPLEWVRMFGDACEGPWAILCDVRLHIKFHSPHTKYANGLLDDGSLVPLLVLLERFLIPNTKRAGKYSAKLQATFYALHCMSVIEGNTCNYVAHSQDCTAILLSCSKLQQRRLGAPVVHADKPAHYW